VQTGMFPLYEVEDGKYKLNYTADPKSVTEYLKSQGASDIFLKTDIAAYRKKSIKTGLNSKRWPV
jgi:kynureninase